MPVLWEIVTFDRGRIEMYSEDLPLIVDRLADLYHLSEVERSEIHEKSKQKKFESDVRYAMDHLRDDDGALTNIQKVSWQITKKGLEFLRAFCARKLRELSAIELREFFESKDENGQDLLLNAIACHSSEAVS